MMVERGALTRNGPLVWPYARCRCQVRASSRSEEKGQVHQYLFKKGVEEDYGLDGFAQAHFVSQDGVGALSPGKAKPVQALQLVHVKRSACCSDKVRLFLVLYGGLQSEQM